MIADQAQREQKVAGEEQPRRALGKISPRAEQWPAIMPNSAVAMAGSVLTIPSGSHVLVSA